MKTVNLIRLFVIFVGISGAFSVLFGAWLAHAGSSLPQLQQATLSTALQYQFIHTLTLLISVVWWCVKPIKWLIAACLCFTLGILCFSGSLYLKTIFDIVSIGKVTPLGGILFAIGWLFITAVGITLVKPKQV